MPSIVRRSVVGGVALFFGAGIAALLATQQIGCSSIDGPGPTPGPSGAPSEPGGTVGLVALTLPGGENVSTVNWVITGPNGTSNVVQAGSVDVQNSAKVAFRVGGIPVGSNYEIALSAVSVDGKVTCAGSAQFSITAFATTNVSVLLQCNPRIAEAGSAAISGQTYNCAAVSGVSVSPSETTVGNSVALTATATAVDLGALAYAWSAPGGTFSSSSSASTSFMCTAPGPIRPPAGCRPAASIRQQPAAAPRPTQTSPSRPTPQPDRCG